MEFIDNVYLINMDKSKERLEKMQLQLPILGRNYTRIKAIDGKELTKDEIDENCTSLCSNFCTKSMIGCFLSHKKAWQTMIDNNDNYAMVMEDDCELVDTFQEDLKEVMNALSKIDWDFLYVGCSGICNTNTDACIFVPDYPVGFHCYIINNNGARKLLKYLDKVDNHVDVSFLLKSNLFNVYACSKDLAYQQSSNEQSYQTVQFPILLNKFFSKFKTSKRIAYSFIFSAPIFQIFGFIINLYLILIL